MQVERSHISRRVAVGVRGETYHTRVEPLRIVHLNRHFPNITGRFDFDRTTPRGLVAHPMNVPGVLLLEDATCI